MANFFVGLIIETIKSVFSDYVMHNIELQTGKKKKLERLREYHHKIQHVLDYVSSQEQIRDQHPDVDHWLWQLRYAIDEASDVLDEFERLEHEEQLTKNMKERKKRKFSRFITSAPEFIETGKRLDDAVHRLENVLTSVDTSCLLESIKQKKKQQDVDLYKERETGSFPTNDLIGRGNDKESLMRWLRRSNDEHPAPNNETGLYNNIFVLSIVGHGGMGKTALLQHVYNDEITKEFDLKMWVFVSNNFDVNRVIADMLESLKKKKPDLNSLVALQNRLQIAVKSKKFLLILDDVWKEKENSDIRKWEKVFAPLIYGKFGSRILVTTRMASVAMMIAKVINKKREIFTLNGLNDDDCLELLKFHAFSDVKNPNDYNISRDIVKKLSGYPLAAKVIGGVLNSDIHEGRRMTILERNSSITSLGENYIYSILRPSYISLSDPLRNCFAFCCLFPQDHLFDKDDFVRMWIASGFIKPPHDQKDTMEDIGGRYFDDLVENSFFDKVEDLPYYKMHVLLHDTASKFYPQEYSRVVNDEKLSPKISETIQHLYIQTINPDILREIGKVKYLHSLFLSYEASNQEFYNALIEILKASKSLRLLCIRTPRGLEKIPDDIGNLKHLRCLKIDGSNLTMLPRSLSNLYHLQYIICDGLGRLSQSEGVDFLPSDMNKLSNLRYLILPLNYISSIHGIGKLKFLQELKMFDLRDVSGYRIGELENMNDLCKLGINCLENVEDVVEACSAKLCAKRRLTELTLCWSDTKSRNIHIDESMDLDENVLNNLMPPKYLRNLSIRNYTGARSAEWMNDVNLISNLEKIELINCEKWETLPPFGQLPSLKSLELCNMPKVKLLENTFNGNGGCRVFQKLKVLRIERLEALEDWFEAGVAVEDVFPSLIELVLKDCPQLKDLPYLPSKLKSLEIENIGWANLNFRNNSDSIPLEILEVSDCPNILSLLLADEIARLAALRYLAIINCPNLISLEKLPDLNISDPSESLSSLREQSINEVSMLRESPNLPPSLKDLSISNCHPELFARYREDGGSDRHKIAHIPRIHIDP